MVIRDGDFELRLPINKDLDQAEKQRIVGIFCYGLAFENKDKCVRLYRSAIDTNQPPNKIYQHCKKWIIALCQRANVHDDPNTGGAPSTVDPKCIDAIIKDIKANEYPSWAVALKAPHNAAALKAAGCSVRHALRLIHERAPELEVVRVEYRQPLSVATKLKRKIKCQELLRHGKRLLGMLLRTFYMDWGKIYVDVTKGTMIVDVKEKGRGTQTRSHASKPTTKGEVIALKFLVVVNAYGGPVLLLFGSGTTGLKTGFKVCRSVLHVPHFTIV